MSGLHYKHQFPGIFPLECHPAKQDSDRVPADCSEAPKIFGGGAGAKSPVGGIGIEHPSDCFAFEIEKMQKIGDDVLIEYKRKVYGK